MTEAEWAGCRDPQPLLAAVQASVSRRKFRLFACACCRRVGRLLNRYGARAVLTAEQFAGGEVGAEQLLSAHWQTSTPHRTAPDGARAEAAGAAAYASSDREQELLWTAGCAARAAGREALQRAGLTMPERRGVFGKQAKLRQRRQEVKAVATFEDAAVPERVAQAELMRCLFGGHLPQRRTIEVDVLRWNDGMVPRIAGGIYEDRTFERLPILADALLDAGCDDEAIIAHCRSEKEHVRGCWVVDLILGKE